MDPAEDSGVKKITVKTDTKAADAHHMPIPHRSFVSSGTGDTERSPGESSDVPETRSSILPTKHTVIKPRSDFKIDPPKNEDTPPSSPKFMDTKPPVKKSAPTQPPASAEPDNADTASEPVAPVENKPMVDAGIDNEKAALASAADQNKRRQEVEDIIESHKYFVPVDTVVQRRTIKVNIGLTVVIFVLALVLIDLMLDSGTILLVQKIPHTHFFSLNDSKQ